MGAGFLGFPLFFRGLVGWGTVMAVLWCARFALPHVAPGVGDALGPLLDLAVMALCLYLGFRGNALAARRFTADGYTLADPESPAVRRAAERLGL